MSVLRAIAPCLVAAVLVGCTGGGADPLGDANTAGAAATAGSATSAGGTTGGGAGTVGAPAAGAAGPSGGAGTSTAGVSGAGMQSTAGGGAAGIVGSGMGGAGGMAGIGGTAGAGAAGAGGNQAAGPKDGDPNAPVVTVPDVPCRQEADVSGSGLGSSINAKIDGRDLAIDYPCGKHEGAQMTVILNLHGTLIGGANFLYQRSYFSAYRLIHSHNLIVVHPKSASMTSFGAQWGNEDGGTDLPHLIAVMNWVYESFSKFNIRSTWIAGHSWGAVYAEGAYSRPGFVCNEMFQDKFKGVIGLSYISTPPCAERVSMIGTQGEEEDFAQLDQGSIAQMHGCDPTMKGPEMVGNNERYYWDGCDPGWVHEDWNMLGKGHIDSMDAEVVLKIVEQIKGAEL